MMIGREKLSVMCFFPAWLMSGPRSGCGEKNWPVERQGDFLVIVGKDRLIECVPASMYGRAIESISGENAEYVIHDCIGL